MIVRKINENDLLETMKLSSICFEYPFTTEGKTEEDFIKNILNNPTSKQDLHFRERWGAFTDDNEMMSCLSLIPFQFQFDGVALKGMGIGGVCTYPHHRKKGAIREIFKASLKDMYQNGVCFSYLYPFSESFYQHFGYQRLTNSTLFELDITSIRDYKHTGSFHLYTPDADMSGFETAYDTFAKKHNMMVLRDEYDWEFVKSAKASYNNNYAYLYKDQNGVPKGYLIFKKEIRNNEPILNCREFIFDDFETLKSLLSFVKSYAADYRKFRFYFPNCYQLDYCCKDFSQYKSSLHIASNGMVRVINVVEVLKKARYLGSGQVTIGVEDNYIFENNNTFTVSYENGIATNVTVVKDPSAPDVTMPIHIFSGAIVGNFKVEDFEFMDEVKIHCESDKLKDVFYSKPSWINNFF